MENTSMLNVFPLNAAVVNDVRKTWLRFFGYQHKNYRATMQHWQLKKLPRGTPTSEYYHSNVEALLGQGYKVTNAFLNPTPAAQVAQERRRLMVVFTATIQGNCA